jgi:hypothetical protein
MFLHGGVCEMPTAAYGCIDSESALESRFIDL